MWVRVPLSALKLIQSSKRLTYLFKTRINLAEAQGEEMYPALRDLEQAFLSAMRTGYATAAGVNKGTIAEMPGSKTIDWMDETFRVLDTYIVTPYSDKSAGMTMLWYQGNPAPSWIMSYGGRYEEIAIPFLKRCLRRAYVEDRLFYGGRGPAFVREERFTYVNQFTGDFDSFSGTENIFDVNGHLLGYHWYRGMALVSD